MKNSIFTIALLLATGIAFGQENSQAESATVKHAINTKGTGATNGRVATPNADLNTVTNIQSKKDYVGHVTLNRREVDTNSSDNEVKIIETNNKVSEKKHNKTGHVTLMK